MKEPFIPYRITQAWRDYGLPTFSSVLLEAFEGDYLPKPDEWDDTSHGVTIEEARKVCAYIMRAVLAHACSFGEDLATELREHIPGLRAAFGPIHDDEQRLMPEMLPLATYEALIAYHELKVEWARAIGYYVNVPR